MTGLLSGLILLLDLRAMDKAATMLGVVGLSLIARHPGQLLIATRIRSSNWRLGAAVMGCIGAALVFGLELGWLAAAAVLALRDWGGLVATLLFGARRGPPPLACSDPLSFAETAARTERVAHRRLTYRISKGLLAMLLGPVGGFAARTGRGAGLDTRLARVVPRSRSGIAALVFAMTAVSSVAFSLSREPAALLLAAAALRVAASAGSILLWWKYAQAVPEADEDDEDD